MADNYRKMLKDVLDFFNKELPVLNVTEQILIKPTSANVMRIYTALLVFSGLRNEKQLLTDTESLSTTDDILMGGRRTLALSRSMEYFIQNAMENSSWTLRDLSSPDHRRTLFFIKELINFSFFANQRYNELEGVFAEKEQRERDELQLRFNLDALKKQAHVKSQGLDQLRGRKHELYKLRDQLIHQVGECRTSRNKVQEQHTLLRTQLDSKQREKTSLEEKIHEVEESNEELRGKLVRSPERLHSEIRDLEEKNEERTKSIQTSESAINTMEQQIHLLLSEADRHLECFKAEFTTVKNDIVALEQMQRERTQFLMHIDREKAAKQKLHDRETKLSRGLENRLRDLESQEQMCRNRLEHLRMLTAQNNENTDAYNEDSERLHSEYVVCQRQIEELKRKLEDHPTDQLRSLIGLKRREIEAEINKLENTNEKLKQDVTELDTLLPALQGQYMEVKQGSLKELRNLRDLDLNQ